MFKFNILIASVCLALLMGAVSGKKDNNSTSCETGSNMTVTFEWDNKTAPSIVTSIEAQHNGYEKPCGVSLDANFRIRKKGRNGLKSFVDWYSCSFVGDSSASETRIRVDSSDSTSLNFTFDPKTKGSIALNKTCLLTGHAMDFDIVLEDEYTGYYVINNMIHTGDDFFKSGSGKRKRDDGRERLDLIWGKQKLLMPGYYSSSIAPLNKSTPDFARITRADKDGPASLDAFYTYEGQLSIFRPYDLRMRTKGNVQSWSNTTKWHHAAKWPVGTCEKGKQVKTQFWKTDKGTVKLYGDRPDVDSASTMTKWSLDDGNEIKQSWTCGGTIQFDYYVREDGKDNYKMRCFIHGYSPEEFRFHLLEEPPYWKFNDMFYGQPDMWGYTMNCRSP